MKIVTVLGARPQFIKAAVVSRAFRETGAIEELLVHTGQHYDPNMSQQFFEELEIPGPRFHLNVGSGAHGEQTGRMIAALESVLVETRPDALLVYGDTNSTLAGALAAAMLDIPIAHVEAGLRSFNRRMPEEINRIVTDRASRWLFAPTEDAAAHLRRERIPESKIFLVGDVMYDAARYFAERARLDRLTEWGLSPKQYVLATIHRAENTNDPDRLRQVFDSLQAVAREVPVVLPLHPRTRAVLRANDLLAGYEKTLVLRDPVGYLEMTALVKNARLIVTDSGGVQKEAFFHRVPCVTLRDETEWMDLVHMGWNTLVPVVEPTAVSRQILHMLNHFEPREQAAGLFGGGNAAPRIAATLLEAFPGSKGRHATNRGPSVSHKRAG